MEGHIAQSRNHRLLEFNELFPLRFPFPERESFAVNIHPLLLSHAAAISLLSDEFPFKVVCGASSSAKQALEVNTWKHAVVLAPSSIELGDGYVALSNIWREPHFVLQNGSVGAEWAYFSPDTTHQTHRDMLSVDERLKTREVEILDILPRFETEPRLPAQTFCIRWKMRPFYSLGLRPVGPLTRLAQFQLFIRRGNEKVLSQFPFLFQFSYEYARQLWHRSELDRQRLVNKVSALHGIARSYVEGLSGIRTPAITLT